MKREKEETERTSERGRESRRERRGEERAGWPSAGQGMAGGDSGWRRRLNIEERDRERRKRRDRERRYRREKQIERENREERDWMAGDGQPGKADGSSGRR